jgi:hypothetical protein
MTISARLLAAGFAVMFAAASHAQMADGQDCGHPFDSPGRFGPFDYADGARHEERQLVDGFHFTAYMQELAVNGFTSLKPTVKEDVGGIDVVVGGNFDYALHAFPNHHRALYAMAVWQLRMRDKSPADLRRAMVGLNIKPAECYFQRAIMYKPDDGLVRQAFGAFLHKAGDLRRAEEQYQAALELTPDSAELHYNAGLLYVALGNYEKAAGHAARADELGYPLQGLQRRLSRMRASSN